ncbi:capsule biosynthesis protein [Octadecabacter sp.]|nr:capsule biosynthesis protein [Octadecabacter sp.]
MTTKPKAQKFRIRRSTTADQATAETSSQTPETAAPAQAMAGTVDSPATVAAETNIDAIRQEGLTGRQLRMARRVAQKNGLAVTSDFDAVRQLREKGIDPFQRANVLELVTPNDGQTDAAAGQMRAATAKVPADQARVQLPQTVDRKQSLPSTQVSPATNAAEQRGREIRQIQLDIARRRRRNIFALFSRLAVFVLLPTIAAGYYFYSLATPMYGTKSEFIIQQAEASAGGGLGSLFSGTGLATQTDSTSVQSYLTSREAFLRLDDELGFTDHFSSDAIDGIQRLSEDASGEDAYGVFNDRVQIGYDPTEGILRMEVIAADPEKSQDFSEALIGYAEERVDRLTQRVREDQMTGSIQVFDQAETRRSDALAQLVQIQEELGRADPIADSTALQQRIVTLEVELDQERINLASLNDLRNPLASRVQAVETTISLLEGQIANLRGQLSAGDGGSIVSQNARLREAEENYASALLNFEAARAQMDLAQIEANKQVRYLSVSVSPIAPDVPTYPKSFENTVLAFLIFSGIYLMISLTSSILREQVSA